MTLPSCGGQEGKLRPDAGGLTDGGVITDPAFNGCASAAYRGRQSPAAMMVVLDRSGTMAQNSKFSFAQQAIINAIDEDVFDTMALGLVSFPIGTVSAPACLFGLASEVDCDVGGLPVVPIQAAGDQKSNAATGVRREIYNWLTSHAPISQNGDGNPTYAALSSAINALKAYKINGKRLIFYITDGGASCASVSSRPGYPDGNGCDDWEYPESIIGLLKVAHDDRSKPINTMVIGVPGTNTNGENPDVPPYSVRNALSAYAASGSPETIDPQCTAKTFNYPGSNPRVSCHFDMSQTSSFSVDALVNAISGIRGKLLGCTFDIPESNDGTPTDRTHLNVTYSVGGKDHTLYKRADSSNPCDEDEGCWDYTEEGRVQLFGKACTDVRGNVNARVNVVVGCATIIK